MKYLASIFLFALFSCSGKTDNCTDLSALPNEGREIDYVIIIPIEDGCSSCVLEAKSFVINNSEAENLGVFLWSRTHKLKGAIKNAEFNEIDFVQPIVGDDFENMPFPILMNVSQSECQSITLDASNIKTELLNLQMNLKGL